MRGAVCRWPFRAATDLLSRRGAGGNNKAALKVRSRKSEAISISGVCCVVEMCNGTGREVEVSLT